MVLPLEYRAVKSLRFKFLLVLLVFALLPVLSRFTTSAAASPANRTASISLSIDEALVLQLLNTERAKNGLSPLVLDSILTQVARLHSADMEKRNYFSHLEPAPGRANPLDRYVRLLGRKPEGVVGENIACCSQPRMGEIHRGFLASPEHKANLLDRQYTHVGIGIYETSDGRVWLTQMFCEKK
jgi:uncharacterized protein YkwD